MKRIPSVETTRAVIVPLWTSRSGILLGVFMIPIRTLTTFLLTVNKINSF
ncbi:MAG: hypothetical protein WBF68_04370 [Atribacterota bacterium]